MKTMNATPMTIAQYEHDHVDVVAKCKKAISKFINTYLVFAHRNVCGPRAAETDLALTNSSYRN